MEKLKWKCVNNLKKSIFNKLYMSGSAALSAAKNRRTGSAPPPPPGNSKSPQQTVIEKQSQGPQNPLQILYMHELRLNELEKFNSENDNNAQKQDSVNEGVIKKLTDKISLLEQQCSVLKEELNKIMSFAMETNRAFLLYKNNKEQEQTQAPAQAVAVASL